MNSALQGLNTLDIIRNLYNPCSLDLCNSELMLKGPVEVISIHPLFIELN